MGTDTVAARGAAIGGSSERGGDFYLATRGDLELATRGDFLMAMDSCNPVQRRPRLGTRREAVGSGPRLLLLGRSRTGLVRAT